jgi:hypothetical protein
MANSWGNPDLKSFKNNYIRRVLVDTARVFVHKNILSEVEELLLRAAAHGAVFSNDGLPTILPAYDFDDSIEASYGVKFQIPNFDTELDVSDLGFTQVSDVFVFTNFTPDTEKTPDPQDNYVDAPNDKIGSKQLKLGSTGPEVKFIAYFLGLEQPSQRETYDQDFVDSVTHFQTRMGIPVTGEVDWYTWNSIIPKGTERIAAGYAGIKVRALQSALIVNKYNPPITSRFGTDTIRTVREFQEDNNLRITGRVGFLEWNVLFKLK